MLVNKKYITPFAWHTDEERKESYWNLHCTIPNILLSGSFDRGIYNAMSKQKNTLIIHKFGSISGINVKKNFEQGKYTFPFLGLVISRQNTSPLEKITLDKSPIIRRALFRPTKIFKQISECKIGDLSQSPRQDYIFSQRSPYLKQVLSAIGAPSDLLLDN